MSFRFLTKNLIILLNLNNFRMDIHRLLDLCEDLLNIYGYEVKRNVGIKGPPIVTVKIEKEHVAREERKREEIVYRADILAEKKEIERPFGRIVAVYKRGYEPVSKSDILQLEHIRKLADAYLGIMLTVTGYEKEALETAKELGTIRIITPQDMEKLIGKAMVRDPRWLHAPAYPVLFSYEDALQKLEYFIEKMLLTSWECIWIFNQQLAYEPYWKFSFYVKKPDGEVIKDWFAINALDGKIDVWWEVAPEKDPNYGKLLYVEAEAIKSVETSRMVPRRTITKPKLPEGVNFVIYRPALEKHEAKIAATYWIAYIYDVDPKDVVITGRELVYYPWWEFYIFYRPIVKNAWEDTEHYGVKISGVYGDVFNQFSLYESFKRDPAYYIFEKTLIRVLGVERYIRLMRRITYFMARAYWELEIPWKQWYFDVLLIFAILGYVYLIYLYITTHSLLVLSILSILLPFYGIAHGFWWILKDYVKRYHVKPGLKAPHYAHPTISPRVKRKIESAQARIQKMDAMLKKLEEMEKKGWLSEKQKRVFEKLKEKYTRMLLKEAK